VQRQHVVVRFPLGHQPGLAAPAEHHRRPQRAVVVVRQRVGVGAGDRHGDQVADLRRGQRQIPHQQVTRLALTADQLHDLVRRGGHPGRQRGLEPLAGERRVQVVGHAAVHRDERAAGVLDRADVVERDARAGHQGPAGLDDQLGAGRQVGAGGFGDGVQVLLHGGRLVLEGVPDAEAAADVVDREGAEHGDRLDGPGERLGVQDLRPDVQVQPVQLQLLAGPDPGDGLAGLVQGQPELGVRAAGGLRLVGFRRDPRDDPDQHPLRPGGQLFQPVDVVEVVHHHASHPGVQGHGQLGGGLGVAVQVHAFGPGPRGQGHDQLTGPGDIDAQPLGGEQRVNRQAGERLRREHHLGVRVAGGEPLAHPAGLVPQPGLVHDVGGRAEALGEVAHAHAADGQLPVWRDGAVLGEEREQVAGPGAG